LTLTTPDGVKLDGAVLWASGMKANASLEDFQASKWIVLYNGNGMFYENWLQDVRRQYPKEVSDTHNFILFNYRGVGDSQGFPNTARDLVLDGITPIDSLKKMGVQDSNIYLEGISLGGGISAQAASHHPKVNVANIKSFSSLPNLLNNVIHKNLTERAWSNCTASSLAWVISGLASHILSTMGWEMNSAQAWPEIHGKKRIETANQDQLMVGDGRLANYLKLQNDPIHLTYDGDHNGWLPPEAIQNRATHFGLA
jgi:pimeloyl-ACP methyl ester carboxylesterase